MPFRRNAPVAAALVAAPLVAGLLAAPLPAGAAPLEPEACAKFRTERQGLIADGVKTDMGKGPEWAKANLSPERLGKIERLIAVEEQLSFRCDELVTAKPQMKEPPKPAKTAGEDGGKQAATPAAGAAGSGDAKATAVQKPAAKKKTVSKVKKKPADAAASAAN